MRVVIAASGGQDKWGNHLGVPSHLAPVHGEPLLWRTVRQALTLTDDVHVTTPGDPRYAVDGAVRHLRGVCASEYHATRDLWSETGRTVLLLGDVYFTERAIQVIGVYGERRYRAFGRKGRSRVTGCRYGELFAVSWWPEHHETLDAHLAEIRELRESGECNRPTGWMLLRAMQGTPLHYHRVDRRFFTSIDDATDDVDFKEDYQRHPAFGQPW